MHRRIKLRLALATIVSTLILGSAVARAQTGDGGTTFPTKPVRIIVPFAPSGPNDILARLIAKDLTEAWGQTVVVDNRPGGGTIIGTDLAAKSPPDGYTLLMVSTSTAVNVTLKRSLPFDTLGDFAPVILLADTPLVLVANLKTPAKSVAELVALGKAKPGQIAYANGGVATATDLAGRLLCQMGGVEMINVPYKGGGPANIDLLAGQVAWMFGTLLPTLPLVKDGQIRALAVSGEHRVPSLPDVPTVAESLPGFAATSWYGVFARAGTPEPVLNKLNHDIGAALTSPQLREHLERDGVEPIGGSRAAFETYFKSEVVK